MEEDMYDPMASQQVLDMQCDEGGLGFVVENPE